MTTDGREVVIELTVDARSAQQGAQAWADAIEVVYENGAMVIKQNQQLAASFDSTGKQISASYGASVPAIERLLKSLDEEYALQSRIQQQSRQFTSVLVGLNREYQAGNLTLDQYNQRVTLVRDGQTKLVAVGAQLEAGTVGVAAANAQVNEILGRSAAAHQKTGEAARFNFQQAEILRSGVINVGQSIAAGLPVGDVLLTQLFQTAPAFAGVGAAALVTAGVIAAAAAPFAVLALAGHQASEELKATQRALVLSGGAAGVTASQFYAMAAQAAQASGITKASALALEQQYAATGKIAGDMLGKLTEATKNWATLTGQSTKDAAAQLAKLFSDPAAGAAELAKSINLLDAAQVQNITTMARAGDQAGAQAALLDAVNERAQKAAESLGYYGKAVNFIADAWDRVKRIGAPDSLPPVQQLAQVVLDYDKALNQLREDQAKAAHGMAPTGAIQADLDALTALANKAEDLRRSIASQANEAKRNAETAAATTLSNQVSGILNALPAAKLQGLNADILALSRAFLTLDPATGKSAISAEQYTKAVQAIRAEMAGMAPPYQRFLDQQQIEIAVLNTALPQRDRVRAQLQEELSLRTTDASAAEKANMIASAGRLVTLQQADAIQQKIAAGKLDITSALAVAAASGVSEVAALRVAAAKRVEADAHKEAGVAANQAALIQLALDTDAANALRDLEAKVAGMQKASQAQADLTTATLLGGKAGQDATYQLQAQMVAQDAMTKAQAAGSLALIDQVQAAKQWIATLLQLDDLNKQRATAGQRIQSAKDNLEILQAQVVTIGQESSSQSSYLAGLREEQYIRNNLKALWNSTDPADQAKVRTMIEAAQAPGEFDPATLTDPEFITIIEEAFQ